MYLYTHLYMFIHICIYTFVYMHVYICIYIYIYIHMYMYTYIYKCIYTYIYIYTYTNICTYTHLYILLWMQWLRYMKESCNTHEEAISSHERVMTHTHAHRTTQANADICTSRGTLINGVCVWLAHTDLQPREQLLT